MYHKFFHFSKQIIVFLLLLFSYNLAKGSITITKTLYLTVGKSINVSPWGDVNNAYPGYSCISTKLMGISDSFVVNVDTGTKTSTTYPQAQTNGSSTGYYYTYKIKATKSGTTTVNLHVSCCKKEGYMPVKYVSGDYIVSYNIIVSEAPKVLSISIPNNVSLTVGEQYTFTPIIHEEGANTTLTWHSSNTSVVAINNGQVTAIAPGASSITCTASNGVTASCLVSVNPILISHISMDKPKIEIEKGENYSIKTLITPENATYKDLKWESTDNSIAIINNSGIVVGISEGYCYINAYSQDASNISASCIIHVKNNPNYFMMDGIVGKVGESIGVSAVVKSEAAIDPMISWYSSDPEVAAVDSEGVVWFNAAGSTTVTAECQGYEFSVPFEVREVMARALNVFPVEAVGGVGHEFSLLAVHEPENTTDKSVTWESSDPEVATVDAYGRVSLASLGSAKITARSGEHTAECSVTVDNNIVNLTEVASTGVVMDIVEGGIVVRNAPAGESIAVYTVDGKVANGAIVESDEVHLKLAAGIYIVKVSPATVAKVLIK